MPELKRYLSDLFRCANSGTVLGIGVRPLMADCWNSSMKNILIDRSSRFAAGDKVVLKSGGPGMTAVDVGSLTGLIWCRWMDADGVSESLFSAETLNKDPGSLISQP